VNTNPSDLLCRKEAEPSRPPEEEEIYICSSRLGLIKMITATLEMVETVRDKILHNF
jgi:hypothetical protein